MVKTKKQLKDALYWILVGAAGPWCLDLDKDESKYDYYIPNNGIDSFVRYCGAIKNNFPSTFHKDTFDIEFIEELETINKTADYLWPYMQYENESN